MYNQNYLPNQNIMYNYVEEYLRGLIGKKIEAHVSFCDSIEWRDSVFNGYLENIGKDYLVIKNQEKLYIIWTIYLDYIVLK